MGNLGTFWGCRLSLGVSAALRCRCPSLRTGAGFCLVSLSCQAFSPLSVKIKTSRLRMAVRCRKVLPTIDYLVISRMFVSHQTINRIVYIVYTIYLGLSRVFVSFLKKVHAFFFSLPRLLFHIPRNPYNEYCLLSLRRQTFYSERRRKCRSTYTRTPRINRVRRRP